MEYLLLLCNFSKRLGGTQRVFLHLFWFFTFLLDVGFLALILSKHFLDQIVLIGSHCHIYHVDSYCNDCRDLDLTRDRALLTQEWRCAVPQCGQPYDRELMENALLQIVRQRERLYHLQDLVCLKCNQVKAAHLAEHCSCAGSFRCKEDVSEFRNKMQLFLNIARDQKFQLLEECTSWILEVM